MALGKPSALWTTPSRRPWSTQTMSSDHSAPVSAHPTGADVLVVDGANVVGSRPDGWWRDRPGAAARLHRRLLATPDLADLVVLVLEGQARAGVPEGRTGAVAVVHAAGEGDDRIVAEAAAATGPGTRVAVVTADRQLRGRVIALGAAVVGPDRLISGLAEDPSASDRTGAPDRLD